MLRIHSASRCFGSAILLLLVVFSWCERTALSVPLGNRMEDRPEHWAQVKSEIEAGRYPEALQLLYQFDFLEAWAGNPAFHEFDRLRLVEVVAPARTPFEMILRARALRYFGKTSDAERQYAELAKKFENSPLLLSERAMFALESGDLVAAESLVARAERRQSSSSYVLVARGAMLQAQGEFEPALVAYNSALKANPYMGGLRGRILLVERALWEADKRDDKPPFDELGYLNCTQFERDELSLGFPWRLKTIPNLPEGQQPYDEAKVRMLRGDLQGAAVSFAAVELPDNLKPWEHGRLARVAALSYLVIGDFYQARRLAGVTRNPEPTVYNRRPPPVSVDRRLPDVVRSFVQQPSAGDDFEAMTKEQIMGNRPGSSSGGTLPTSPEFLPKKPDADQKTPPVKMRGPETAEDYLYLAGYAANTLHLASTVGGVRQSVDKLLPLLDKLATIPSIAQSDPLTAEFQVIPDAAAMKQIKSVLDFDERSFVAAQGLVKGKPNVEVMLELEAHLGGAIDRLSAPRLVRARALFTVREQVWDLLHRSQLQSEKLGALGRQLYEAKGELRNREKAIRMLERAAENSARSALYLAKIYDTGSKDPRELSWATYYYGQAVQMGIREAEPRFKILDAEWKKVLAAKEQKEIEELGGLDVFLALQQANAISERLKPKRDPMEMGVIGGRPKRAAVTSKGDGILSEGERGNALAQWLIGHRYADKGDNKEAFAWFLKAAEQGVSPAQFEVGRAYYFGVEVTPDLKVAKSWLERAVAGGAGGSANDLLTEFERIAGLERTPRLEKTEPKEVVGAAMKPEAPKSTALIDVTPVPLSQAAEDAAIRLHFDVVNSADEGRFQAKLKELEELGTTPNPAALFWLGKLYSTDGKFHRANPAQAIRYWQAAATSGFTPAQHHLGLAYMEGMLVEKNLRLAEAWLEQAVKQRWSRSEDPLKQVREELRKDAPMSTEATTTTSASLGGQPVIRVTPRQFSNEEVDEANLLRDNVEQATTEQDFKRSLAALTKLASEGNFVAVCRLGQLYSVDGRFHRADPAVAIDHLQRAAQEGFSPAQWTLGVAYLEGKITKKNLRLAEAWLEQSNKQGFRPDIAPLQRVREELRVGQPLSP